MTAHRLPAAWLLLLTVLLLTPATAARAQTCTTPTTTPFPPAPAAFSHTAVADGDWNNVLTWSPAAVPGNGAVVSIPAGKHVSVKSQESASLRYIQVNGELRMWIHSPTRLVVDTLVVASGGLFVVGDSVNTVKPGVLAELVFKSWDGNSITRSWDPAEQSRGFISMGQVRVFGESKTHMVPMTADALKASTSITLNWAPVNWKVGDEIVLTGSYFRRVGTQPASCTAQATPSTSSQDERLTITGISGATVSFSPALVYDHIRARSDFRLHVANLTRNFRFRSDSTSVPLRGHVMLMNGDVDIRGAAFINLGRTNKAVPLDDMVVALLPPPPATATEYSITPQSTSLVTNRRGRYAVHFHLNGTALQAKVWGSVVDGTVGWGFVNHSSNVDFKEDVAYNFTGAGFVTEAGDELGNFTSDVAIRGGGNGQYRPDRIVFQNACRPQPLADFAFSGDGFWFQGPALRAKGNVAAGCDGAGMIWFTPGSPDVTNRFDVGGGVFHDCYTGFPRASVATVYAGFPDLAAHQPRNWNYNSNKLLVSDLPILECDGFEGYGNLVGFRLRFNDHDNVAWYTEDPFDFDDQIVPVSGSNKAYAVRMREKVKNLTLWNNEKGFSMRYVTDADWTTVTNVNRLDYNATSPYEGAELVLAIESSSISGLTTDGYEVAGTLETCDQNERGRVTIPAPNYTNYATVDTWKTDTNSQNVFCSTTCPVPTVLAVVNTGTTSRRIDLQAQSLHGRYLVRYRVNGGQQWKYASSTTTSVTLTGLQTGKTYTYQVIAGCKEGSPVKETRPSNYTTAGMFTT